MFRNTRYGIWNFHLFMFQFVSKRFKTIECGRRHFRLFQFVSVVLLYNLYVSKLTRNGVWNFHFFMFQFVSKHFETIESVDLDIFSLFQFVSEVLLYNLHVYVSMFRNTRYGVWNFHLFMFQFVSKQLKVWTKTFSASFSLFQQFYYIL